MFWGHLSSFLCSGVPSPLRFFVTSPLCFFYPYTLALPTCSPCHRTPLAKMPANKNKKKACVVRARHAAAQRNNHDSPAALSLCPRRSARGSRRITPEGPDGRHSERHEGLGSRPYISKLEDCCARHWGSLRAIQAQATLAARQGEESAKVRQSREGNSQASLQIWQVLRSATGRRRRLL